MLTIYPIRNVTALDNQSNGELSPALLKDVGFNQKLWTTAAEWFLILKRDFEAQRKRILNFTYGGCYRTYLQQRSLFLSRYDKVSYAKWLITPRDKRKTWKAIPKASAHYADNPTTTYWVKKVIGTLPNGQPRYPATAAVPGYSNHGEGMSIDLAIGLPAHAVPLNKDDIAWLVKNLTNYGFCWESTAEPWHITWFMGNDCPAYKTPTP